MLNHTCLHCGATFCRPNNPNRPYKFCSPACRGQAQVDARPKAVCDQCGTEFTKWPCDSGKRATCSKDCGNKRRDKGRTTAAFRIRTSKPYAEWRKAVFARDNYTCQACGTRGGKLNADHIKRFSDHPELRLSVGNGRTLCVPCHLATDTYGNRKSATDCIATGTEA